MMSTAELERVLLGRPTNEPVRLTIEEALAFRDAGNVPDERGRTLRLVLVADDADDVRRLHEKRLRFEPDYHHAPRWRRADSRPINVVPIKRFSAASGDRAWWEEGEVAALESEWQRSGTVGGIRVPGDYRSFVYKTVIALRAAGLDVTPDSIADSVARWLPREDADRLRAALREANSS